MWPCTSCGRRRCGATPTSTTAPTCPTSNEIYKLYRTSDGWAMVYSVATQAHWRNMCTALGRLDLAEDPR
ncbi:MAG: CoA transferase, partial [Acidimicrobiia bacterium]